MPAAAPRVSPGAAGGVVVGERGRLLGPGPDREDVPAAGSAAQRGIQQGSGL